MQIGMVGLGRMGANMTKRLMAGGHEVVVYERVTEKVREMQAQGAGGAETLEALVKQLRPPRAVWLMVPAGEPTESNVQALSHLLAADDVIIDGGNSFYKDDVRRAAMLRASGIRYVDVGTSGGLWGLERGYCLMIGGPRDVVDRLDPIFKTLAPGQGNIPLTPHRSANTAEQGYLYCGLSGAGHFVKMIHNGIEYGLMQAYAEGFDILRHAQSEELEPELRYTLNVGDIAEVWRRGSVISSWLLDLTSSAMAEDPELARYTGFVQDSGEGRWTIAAAIEEAVPAEVLSAALYARFRSRQTHTFSEKVLSAMREKFGGHQEKPPAGG